jgi:hypothetical protein
MVAWKATPVSVSGYIATTVDELGEEGDSHTLYATPDGDRLDDVEAGVTVQQGGEVFVFEDPYSGTSHATTYYHVAPRSEGLEIRQDGLFPGTAGECSCGQGIHLCTSLEDANAWADQLANERGVAEWTIYEVRVPHECDIVTDEYAGPPVTDGFIACTTIGIPPEYITFHDHC